MVAYPYHDSTGQYYFEDRLLFQNAVCENAEPIHTELLSDSSAF